MTEAVALVGGRCVLPTGVQEDVAILCRNGRIEDIRSAADLDPEIPRVDVGGRIITAGLIDIHNHGALGHSFGETDAAVYDRLLEFLAHQGITSAVASLVSAPIGELERTLEFAAAYQPAGSGSNLLGVHLEGPFIATDQCGAHDPQMLRPPRPEDADRLLAFRNTLRMITLAPELPGAIELTRRLAGAGIVVAAGHSSASGEDLQDATAAGARHLTHLWSGQSGLTRRGPWRNPGLLENSLASNELTAEIIADGRHLPPALLQIARRCLPGRLCVVSDATAGAGLADGTRYRAGTVECVVRDGVGMVIGADSFAGSTTPINAMVRHLVHDLGWPLAEVITMATRTPAAVVGVDGSKGSLLPGFDADITIFDEQFAAWATMIGGRWVHGRDVATIA